jgi:hypothetical protein
MKKNSEEEDIYILFHSGQNKQDVFILRMFDNIVKTIESPQVCTHFLCLILIIGMIFSFAKIRINELNCPSCSHIIWELKLKDVISCSSVYNIFLPLYLPALLLSSCLRSFPHDVQGWLLQAPC